MEISQRKLMILSIVLAVLGVAVAYLYFDYGYEKVEIGTIQSLPEGRRVYFAGFVKEIVIAERTKVVLCDAAVNCINVYFRADIYNPTFISKGEVVKVEGRVLEYMGRKRVEAERIWS
ncbi:MAG: hypothetical protein QXW70_00355 [Candidatus Anstonellales archaeon]